MRVILLQTIRKLGKFGQKTFVANGYGRNYLIPYGLAYVASEANMARLQEEQARKEEHSRRDILEARRRASQLEGKALIFHERAGEDGKLFGSVTENDIADRAREWDLDFELDKRSIQLEEAIKIVGAPKVSVRLHAEVEVDLEVQVEPIES